jgi:DNA-binding transcriptional MerR regulator
MTVGLTSKAKVTSRERAYSIGELAELFGVTPRAIRFYEDRGLLTPRRVGKTRIFSDRERVRLDFILRGKRLGISLAEIGDWLDLYNMEDGERRQYKALLEGSRQRIADLERQRADLEETLKELRTIEAIALEGLGSDSERANASGAGKRAQRAERNR